MDCTGLLISITMLSCACMCLCTRTKDTNYVAICQMEHIAHFYLAECVSVCVCVYVCSFEVPQRYQILADMPKWTYCRLGRWREPVRSLGNSVSPSPPREQITKMFNWEGKKKKNSTPVFREFDELTRLLTRITNEPVSTFSYLNLFVLPYSNIYLVKKWYLLSSILSLS